MRNLFISECIKLKRKKIIALFVAAIIIDIFIVSTTILDIAQPRFDLLYLRSFSVISTFLHPFIISIIGIYIISGEYKNNTIIHLITAPISPVKFIFSKAMILAAMALLLTIAAAIMFSAGFVIIGNEASVKLLGRMLVHLFTDTITFSIAFLPIFLIIVLSRNNEIIPIISFAAYSGIVFFKNTGALFDEKYSVIRWIIDYLHPLGSANMVHTQLLHNFFPNPEIYSISSPNVNWMLFIVCFSAMSLLTIGLIIAALRKQDY